ncbi:MAG: hypothetical protein OES47_01620 [Acidobacteriota bacterium]|nr:hypothetical protein [Acidobacteriota bacterium]
MKKKSLVTMTLGAAFLMAAFLPAQMEPAPYITIHYDRIDPAQSAAFEQNNKDWVEAFSAAKAGADFHWRGYQSGFTYAWVSDLPSYAFLDGNDAREKMLNEKMGEGKLEALEGGARGAIIEHHNEIWKHEPDLTYQPEGFSPEGMGAVEVTTVDIKPSMNKEYRELVKEAIAALKKIEAPINFLGNSTPYGEGSYTYVSWGKDRASLHSAPGMGKLLAEAVGEEKAQEMFAHYMNCVSNVAERDWRVRDDISYISDGEMMGEDKESME